jgi:hypothetical protein
MCKNNNEDFKGLIWAIRNGLKRRRSRISVVRSSRGKANIAAAVRWRRNAPCRIELVLRINLL